MSDAYFPVFLDLRDRRCVVLGDGALADVKAASLRDTGAHVVHLRRAFVDGDLAGAYLAVDASDARHLRDAVRAEAERERVLLNIVDDAPRCDWIAPAVVRRGRLQVAVSTGGASPVLAASLRGQLESLLGPEWEALTDVVGDMRARLRDAGVPVERQRAAYSAALHSGARAALRAGDTESARATVAAIESRARRGAAEPGSVTIVGAGPGDDGLLTLAGREALALADVVVHDALVDASVLAHCRPGASLVAMGKRGGGDSASQDDINEMLVAAARGGAHVVRLKGGDPFLFGRGGEEVRALTEAGVPVRVIPGVSSALAAPAAAGIPVTHRGVAQSVTVITGRGATGEVAWRDHARSETLVVLMPGDIATLAARIAAVCGRDRPAAVVSNAHTAQQGAVRGTLRTIGAAVAASGLEGPWVLVVGEVVDLADDGAFSAAAAEASAAAG